MVAGWLHSKLVRFTTTNTAVVLMAYLAMWLLAVLALNLSFLNPVAQIMREFSHTDIYYHVLQESPEVDTSRVVTIVDMTELQRRGTITNVLQQIEKLHPKVVGVDIVFEGLKDDSLSDQRLRQLVEQYKDNIVFSYRMLDYIDEQTGYADDVHSYFVNEGMQVNEGFTDFERELYSGIKRTLSLSRLCRGEERVSLVNKVFDLYSDGEADLKGRTDLNINFRPLAFKVIASDSVSFYPELIANHIVLFGATHEICDMHYTPLGKMAGIELLGYSLQTLLEQQQVIMLPDWLNAIIAFLIALISWLWLKSYSDFARRQKNEVFCFFLNSTYVKAVIVFIWMATLVWLSFLAFYKWNVSINIGWGLASIPFLAGAKEFCDMMAKMLKQPPKKFFNKRQRP